MKPRKVLKVKGVPVDFPSTLLYKNYWSLMRSRSALRLLQEALPFLEVCDSTKSLQTKVRFLLLWKGL